MRLRNLLPALCCFLVLNSVAAATEQAGPNPGNLAPTGSQSVSLLTGAFTYSYPIEVPPGRNGMQPDVKLIYNSQGDNGWLGIGWTLDTGCIYRSTKNGVPGYTFSDTFIFSINGQTQELVEITSNADYREYRAQIESGFTRFRYYITGDYAGKWLAWSKDGKKYEFAGLVEANSTYFYWALLKVTDTSQNYMDYVYPDNTTYTIYRTLGGSGTSGGTITYLPKEIRYGGNAASGLPHKYSVRYAYEPRPDVLTNCRAGTEQKLAERIVEIEVSEIGDIWQPLRKCSLSYGQTTAGFSRLLSIQKYSYENSLWVAHPGVTTFNWADHSRTDVSAEGYAALPPVDFIWRESCEYPVNQGAELIDVNGDNLPDIVQRMKDLSGEVKSAWINTGNGWQKDTTETWVPPIPIVDRAYEPYSLDNGVRFADLNGDGLVDVVQSEESLTMPDHNNHRSWLNTGHGWEPAPECWNPPLSFVRRLSNSSTGDMYTQLVDVNGDGRADIVRSFGEYIYFGYISQFVGLNQEVFINNGNGWTLSSEWQMPLSLEPHYGIRFVDFTCDGLVDIITEPNWPPLTAFFEDYARAWINNGKGWTAASAWASPAHIVTNAGSDNGVRFVDINNDGLVDIVQYVGGNDGPQKGVWLNTGSGWAEQDLSMLPPVRLIDRADDYRSYDEGVRLADINGDGTVDLFQSQESNLAEYVNHYIYMYNSKPANVITSIKDELKGEIRVCYDTYNQKDLNMPFAVCVATAITTSDGLGNAVTVNYSYAGGLFDRTPADKKEFLGFKQVTTMDADGNYTLTAFCQNEVSPNEVNIFKGKISSQESRNSLGELLSRTENSYDYTTPWPGVYFPRLTQVDNYAYDYPGGTQVCIHTRGRYAYDSYGNVTTQYFDGETDTTSDDKREVTVYGYNDGAYLVSYPANKTLYDNVGTPVSETRCYYEAGFVQVPVTGKLTRAEKLNPGSENSIVMIFYDNYGNVVEEHDALYTKSGGTSGNRIVKTYDSSK